MRGPARPRGGLRAVGTPRRSLSTLALSARAALGVARAQHLAGQQAAAGGLERPVRAPARRSRASASSSAARPGPRRTRPVPPAPRRGRSGSAGARPAAAASSAASRGRLAAVRERQDHGARRRGLDRLRDQAGALAHVERAVERAGAPREVAAVAQRRATARTAPGTAISDQPTCSASSWARWKSTVGLVESALAPAQQAAQRVRAGTACPPVPRARRARRSPRWSARRCSQSAQ